MQQQGKEDGENLLEPFTENQDQDQDHAQDPDGNQEYHEQDSHLHAGGTVQTENQVQINAGVRASSKGSPIPATTKSLPATAPAVSKQTHAIPGVKLNRGKAMKSRYKRGKALPPRATVASSAAVASGVVDSTATARPPHPLLVYNEKGNDSSSGDFQSFLSEILKKVREDHARLLDIDYFLIWTGERRPCTFGGSRSETICRKAPGKDEIHFDLEEIMAEMESGERCAWLRDRSFQSELGVSCFRAEQGDCQD